MKYIFALKLSKPCILEVIYCVFSFYIVFFLAKKPPPRIVLMKYFLISFIPDQIILLTDGNGYMRRDIWGVHC
jgi:hypothetical protein